MGKSWYQEYRCEKCQKLFFKGVLVDSEIEVKCKRCHHLQVLRGIPADKLVCKIEHCPNRV